MLKVRRPKRRPVDDPAIAAFDDVEDALDAEDRGENSGDRLERAYRTVAITDPSTMAGCHRKLEMQSSWIGILEGIDWQQSSPPAIDELLELLRLNTESMRRAHAKLVGHRLKPGRL